MKAIITAAWYWTRMLPFTKVVPKELIPVWNKPVIQYIVEWLVSSKIKDIIIVTSNHKEAIENHFDKNYELEEILKKKWKIELLKEINKTKDMANYIFVKQKEQLWLAHALLPAKNIINEDFFLLTVWDTIFDEKIFKEMLEIHKKNNSSVIWLKEVEINEVSKYWVVDIKNWKIVNLVEKPSIEDAPSNKIMVWIYILPKKIFSIIENLKIVNWEYLLPDAILKLMKTDSVIPYTTKHNVYDVWNIKDWLKANNELFWEYL